MHRSALALALLACSTTAAAQDASFDGVWRTSLGDVTLKQSGKDVTGTYGNRGRFTIQGKVDGKALTIEYQEGDAAGDAKFTLDDSGRSFAGGFQVRNGRSGAWNGWRPDPEASKAARADFAGTWLTTLGLMDLAQDGGEVKGKYAIRGTSDITGDASGRHLEYRYKGLRDGGGWFDLAADRSTLAGAARGDGAFGWYAWSGRPAPEFARHAKLVPGKTVDGSTANLLTYSVRAPEGYDPSSRKVWPAVVILHGSNMNGRSYVETIASAWPDVARDFILLGVNGEVPSSIAAGDPRFNFSYVNYVGRSTFKGFPGTDRESPALVAEALTDLKGAYPIRSYLVGGHSQGGFLTYSLLMNSPELIAGAFPISAGVIFQCEPSAYDDETLKRAQRKVPLAIVHGTTDPVVDVGMGRYAVDAFGDSGWPAFHFFTSPDAGHMFARLPVGEAIRWLDAQSADDPARLLGFAESRLQPGGYRDAVAALIRLKEMKSDPAQQGRVARLSAAVDAAASPDASALLARLRANEAGWIDGFLAYRDQFQFADAARDAMAAYDALRARQEAPARKLFNDARGDFRRGNQADGYAKYQEIVDEQSASSLYRIVARSLRERN